MVKDEKDVVEATNQTKIDKQKRTTRATKATKSTISKVKSESERTDDKKTRTVRTRRTNLSERALIREKIREWERDEVRSTQARLNKSMKVLNFKMDPRNADALDKFINANGLGKALTVDLAIFRFITDIEDRAVKLPYEAIEEVDIVDNENVSFKISATTKERLDKFCKSKRQQTQLIANVALQCFLDENRNILEEVKID